jgi:probable selenium-dependent hydroxylase accessory protein YqeC
MTSLRDGLGIRGGGVISIVGAGGKTSLMFRLAAELASGGEIVLTTTTTKILRPDNRQSPHVILSGSVTGIVDHYRTLLKHHRHMTAAAREASPGKLAGLSPEVVDGLHRTRQFQWIIVEADGAARMPLKAPAAHEPVIPRNTDWLIGVVGLEAVGKPLGEPYVFRPDLFSEITGLARGDAISAEAVATALIHQRGIMKGAPPTAKRRVFLNKADRRDRLASGRKIVRALRTMTDNRPLHLVIGTAIGDSPVCEVYRS